MSATILTSAWEAIPDKSGLNFSPVFTQPTTHIFINLITGWILCTKRRTVTGILTFADPKNKRPHDAYHRLFPRSRWLPAHLWKLLAQMVIKLFYPAGIVWMDMDDTIFHRTGQKVDGAGWWRDTIRSTASYVVHCCGNELLQCSAIIPYLHELSSSLSLPATAA